MRLNTNHGPVADAANELHANPALPIREITEDEIIARILERRGPGSLMDDLTRFPLDSARTQRIRLR